MLRRFAVSAFVFLVIGLHSADALLRTRRRERFEKEVTDEDRRPSWTELHQSLPRAARHVRVLNTSGSMDFIRKLSFDSGSSCVDCNDEAIQILRETGMNGTNASLDQKGYAAVARLKTHKQMGQFLARVIVHYNATIIDGGGFAGTVPHFSGEFATQTYTQMVRTLREATWLINFQDASKQPLNEDGYKEVATMADDDQMRAFIRRVIAKHGGTIPETGESGLHDITPEHSGTNSVRSYEELVQELNACTWIKNFRSTPVKQVSPGQLQLASTKYNFVKENPGDELLFIGVFSAPKNFERRMEVRNSWMQDVNFKGENPIMNTMFIIGDIEDKELKFKVDEESRMYGDIHFLSTVDTYENLPSKSVEFFRWYAKRYCCLVEPAAHWYVMKLDDDTWPNFDYLLPFIDDKKESPTSLNYIGGLLWNGPVLREGKWAETADINRFDLDQYPAYAAGSGYIMSMDLVRHLDEIVEERGITLLRNEDTTIGNWIHEEDHLTMAVNYHDLTFREYGCDSGQHLAMNLCPGEMRCMWEKRLNATKTGLNVSEDMCCNPPEDYGLPAEGCL